MGALVKRDHDRLRVVSRLSEAARAMAKGRKRSAIATGTTETASVVADAAPGQTYLLTTDTETQARLGRVRQKNTKPELVVRRLLFRMGHRFRASGRGLPGSPDIVNRSRAYAIFVHGCFWHRHEGCVKATVPKRNREFWVAKLEANRARDQRAIGALEARGLRVLVVWQCETEDPAVLERRLAAFFDRLQR